MVIYEVVIVQRIIPEVKGKNKHNNRGAKSKVKSAVTIQFSSQEYELHSGNITCSGHKEFCLFYQLDYSMHIGSLESLVY